MRFEIREENSGRIIAQTDDVETAAVLLSELLDRIPGGVYLRDTWGIQ